MLLTIVIMIAGFAVLIKGGDIFVSGSSEIARRLKVPGLIIGLTIVAIGTSSPELAVSVIAAVQGENEIAFSNVVGSNLLNMLCILGICAMIKPIPVDTEILRRDFPFSIAVTTLVFAITSASLLFNRRWSNMNMERKVGTATRLEGAILVVLIITYVILIIYTTKKHGLEEADDSEGPSEELWKSLLKIILGIALVVAGGNAVVNSAEKIAQAAGISETIIGMTVVAFGTSLPELVTSVIAAKKGETGMAVGNVIGSNIFNILLILGVSAAIHPIEIMAAAAVDMMILICMNILLFIFAVSGSRISRREGLALLILFAADMLFVVLR